MSLDRNVSSTTVHHDNLTTTDDSLILTYLLLLLLALAPKVTMDFTLSLSGTLPLGTCDSKPGVDAAKQKPVSLDPDLREMPDHALPLKSQTHKLLDLKLGGNSPVKASGLYLKEVFKLHKASRASSVDHNVFYLTTSLGSRSEIARRKDGRGRAMTPPSKGGGDILNQFLHNILLPWPGTAGRHRSPVMILKLDKIGAGRHSALESLIGQFLAGIILAQPNRGAASFLLQRAAQLGNAGGEEFTKSRQITEWKCSFKSARLSRWR